MPKLATFRAKPDSLPSAAPESAITTILHVDMDAFFVSVELLARPKLRGKPVVVGGQPDQRGVVSAASYEARKFGIHSAMPLRTAGRLCPHAVFTETHHELYSEWSDRVAAILGKYSPVVEMASVDEAYWTWQAQSVCMGRRSPPRMPCCSRLRRVPGCRVRRGLRARVW